MRKTPLGQAFLARVMAGTAIATGVSLAFSVPVYAQGSEVSLNVKSGPLSNALNDFASQTGYQLLYPSDLVAGKTSAGVNGGMSVSDGLSRVLSGTGLGFSLLDGKTIQIAPFVATSADGEKVAGVVNVEGLQGSPYFGGAGQAAGVNGINGSRDITATEGTGSFTSGALTIGSKVPLAPVDIPQSVSVLTAERFEQQNITDFTSAMRQLPGVTLVQDGSSIQNKFFSRGFAINSIQIDGGAPLSIDPNKSNFQPLIDMALYDHIELLRGAEGLYNGYGDPGGSINLVRKKPLDHGQVVLEVQAGSWNNYRGMIDVSSPLGLNGKLRGRAVISYESTEFFYDIANSNHTTLYAVIDADVTSSTTLTAGLSYTKQDDRPWFSGLPRYENGDDLGLPRDTCICFTWNKFDSETTELFGQLDQDFGNRWHVSFRAARITQESVAKNGATYGPINEITKLGHTLGGGMGDFGNTQILLDFNANGTFMLFGQEQRITFGANWQHVDDGGSTQYNSLIQDYPAPSIDVLNFDPYDASNDEVGDQRAWLHIPVSNSEQFGAFASLLLTPLERTHLAAGVRYTKFRYSNVQEYICTITFSFPEYGLECPHIGDIYQTISSTYKDESISPPTFTLTYDISARFKAHLTYSRIYQTQAKYLTLDLQPLPPLTGMNLEAGLKYATEDGRLNISVSAYTIKQNNSPIYAGYAEVPTGFSCCYRIGNTEYLSHGADFEIVGEIFHGFNFSLGYTFNYNKAAGSDYYGEGYEGPMYPLESRQPKHLAKLWASYRFDRAGWLNGLTISAGVNAQSEAYRAGNACIEREAFPGTNCLEYKQYSYTQEPYAIVSARIELPLGPNLNAALNIDNLTDLTYYQTPGSSETGNWYGAPRSVMFSLRGKW